MGEGRARYRACYHGRTEVRVTGNGDKVLPLCIICHYCEELRLVDFTVAVQIELVNHGLPVGFEITNEERIGWVVSWELRSGAPQSNLQFIVVQVLIQFSYNALEIFQTDSTSLIIVE
jgi:hypothetical protein